MRRRPNRTSGKPPRYILQLPSVTSIKVRWCRQLANRKWTDFWPDGVSGLKKSDLQSLDEAEFQKLAKMVHRREQRTTGSQKHANKVRRKLQLRRRSEKRIPFSKKALNYRYLDCPNLASIRPNRAKDWRPLVKRKSKTSDVDCINFSFIDDPIETMRTFEKIVSAECQSKGFRINFADKYIQDIGPYLFLGALRQKMTPVVLGGKISASTQKVLEAVQLRSFLQMGSFGRVKSTDVWPLPMRDRRGAGQSSLTADIAVQASRVERVADQTVRSVNEWLQSLEPAEELTRYGASNLKTVVTEALNNSERHGRLGGDGEWVTAGFMARRPARLNGRVVPVHVCNIGLMNLGRPISQTILEAPEGVLDQLKRYIKLHADSGLSDETLATVFALQDGISRVDQSGDSPSGGTGMMDIVEFANGVGVSHGEGLDTRVAIVSGKSYVRFAGPFRKGDSASNGRRLQWFNAENSVEKPPSSDYVKNLPCAFPGTLVTTRFVIDQSDEDWIND